jgi:Fe-Mn family superoxide dismutase
MDFGAAAGQYVDAFFNNINWESVLARIEAL